MLHPLVAGLVATALAVLQVFGWLAIGSAWPRLSATRDAAPSVALLAGSAVTAFIYACASAAGVVGIGLAVGIATAAIAGIARHRQAIALSRQIAGSHAALWGHSRFTRAAACAALALAWLVAIAPPRDGDVMRYHLAHVRQILAEGAWRPIADYHYALPFAWTLNFLPFEAAGLPQAAHLISLAAWVIALGLIAATLQGRVRPLVLGWACAIVTLQPIMFKQITTAHADAYAMLVVLVTAVLAHAATAAPGFPAMTALGFVAWVGIGSRYQLIAAGIVSSVLVTAALLRRRIGFDSVRAYLLGATVAVAAALPFYIMNATAFGNPVWPVLNDIFGAREYADHVAASYHASLTGAFSLETLASGFRQLITSAVVFPISLALIGFVVIARFTADREVRSHWTFVVSFVALWAATQPLLYARFVLTLAPVLVLGGVPMLSSALPRIGGRWARVLVGTVAIATAAAAGAITSWYSADALHYAFTGDRDRYHRHTNYMPVYRWIARATPPDARFLTVVWAAQTYYLDRFYRRADPQTSGVIDWPAMTDGATLARTLRDARFSHVIFEARDWSSWRGGAQMRASVDDAIRRGLLQRDTVFSLDYSYSRLMRRTYPTEVWVLRVRSP